MDVPPSTPTNNRLRQERIRRNWRQQDVADQLGTTAVTVKRWERGRQQPSAFRSGQDVQRLEPGQSTTATWGCALLPAVSPPRAQGTHEG